MVVDEPKKKDGLTYVVVEPCEEPQKDTLLLEDTIPPGCIQHIIRTLKRNEYSKEECDRLCGVLCNVYMDDDASRKMAFLLSSTL